MFTTHSPTQIKPRWRSPVTCAYVMFFRVSDRILNSCARASLMSFLVMLLSIYLALYFKSTHLSTNMPRATIFFLRKLTCVISEWPHWWFLTLPCAGAQQSYCCHAGAHCPSVKPFFSETVTRINTKFWGKLSVLHHISRPFFVVFVNMRPFHGLFGYQMWLWWIWNFWKTFELLNLKNLKSYLSDGH